MTPKPFFFVALVAALLLAHQTAAQPSDLSLRAVGEDQSAESSSDQKPTNHPTSNSKPKKPNGYSTTPSVTYSSTSSNDSYSKYKMIYDSITANLTELENAFTSFIKSVGNTTFNCLVVAYWVRGKENKMDITFKFYRKQRKHNKNLSSWNHTQSWFVEQSLKNKLIADKKWIKKYVKKWEKALTPITIKRTRGEMPFKEANARLNESLGLVTAFLAWTQSLAAAVIPGAPTEAQVQKIKWLQANLYMSKMNALRILSLAMNNSKMTSDQNILLQNQVKALVSAIDQSGGTITNSLFVAGSSSQTNSVDTSSGNSIPNKQNSQRVDPNSLSGRLQSIVESKPQVTASPSSSTNQAGTLQLSQTNSTTTPQSLLPVVSSQENSQQSAQMGSMQTQMLPHSMQMSKQMQMSQSPLQPQSSSQPQPPSQSQSQFRSQSPIQTQSSLQSQSPSQPQSQFKSQSPIQPQSSLQSQSPSQPQSQFKSQSPIQPQSPLQPQSVPQSQSPSQPQSQFRSQPPIQPQSSLQSQSPSQPQSQFKSQLPLQSQSPLQPQFQFRSQPPSPPQPPLQPQPLLQTQTPSSPQLQFQPQSQFQLQSQFQSQFPFQPQSQLQPPQFQPYSQPQSRSQEILAPAPF